MRPPWSWGSWEISKRFLKFFLFVLMSIMCKVLWLYARNSNDQNIKLSRSVSDPNKYKSRRVVLLFQKKAWSTKKFQPVENELLFFWGGPLACWHANHLQFCRLRYRKRYSESNTLLKHKGWKLTTQIDHLNVCENYWNKMAVWQVWLSTKCCSISNSLPHWLEGP